MAAAQTASDATTASTAQTPSDDASSSSDVSLFDSSVVHDLELTFDDADYEAMIDAYSSTGDKEWIEGTVTIDGTTYEHVGLRLKGNSSLRGLGTDGGAGGPGGSASSDAPETLPWLIRLDKYVDGQEHDGYTSFVVRANNSETSLNEAVALELIGLAGGATQQAVATRFSVNGGDSVLRLTIENPDDRWHDANFDTDGVLYKAESTGDYSYRGDDPAAYDEVFDQETDTDDEDLTPLIELLEFLNDTDDATFAAELDQHLDVEAFARYLALQELVANFDDIDGPGNNSYLRYDEESGVFTVVPWDLNLAFGGMGGMGGGGRPGGELPAGAPQPPDGAEMPGAPGAAGGMPGGMSGELPGGMPGGMPGGNNVLVERFLADEDFEAMYQDALTELREELYDSGVAAEVLAGWTSVLESQASDLVDSSTVESEAAAIARYFEAR